MVIWKDYRFRKNFCFCLSFLSRSFFERSGRISLLKDLFERSGRILLMKDLFYWVWNRLCLIKIFFRNHLLCMATVAMSCGNKLLIQNLIPDNTKYKLNFWLVKTLLSYYFQTLLPPEVIFTSSENVFFSKSFIPSSGNLFSF